jgi:hypothetical protein
MKTSFIYTWWPNSLYAVFYDLPEQTLGAGFTPARQVLSFRPCGFASAYVTTLADRQDRPQTEILLHLGAACLTRFLAPALVETPAGRSFEMTPQFVRARGACRWE